MGKNHLSKDEKYRQATEQNKDSRELRLKNMLESYNKSQGYSFEQSGDVFDQINQYVPTKVRAGTT